LLRRPSLVTKVCKERWFIGLTILLVAGAIVTGLTNGMPVLIRRHHPLAPGIHLTDGLYSATLFLSQLSLPFYLGWALFRTEGDLRSLLSALVIASLIYVPFALYEIRMSPNLHGFVYGFSQHDFAQTVRSGGGYRPMVFMSHGLSLARFFFIGASAAFLLARSGSSTVLGLSAKWIGWFLVLILILCKSVGAILFTGTAVPLLLWSKPKLQARIALGLALFVGLYPLSRTLDLIPTEKILSALRVLVGEDRTGSLDFRFVNENILLEKARQHLMFGWGQYGRNFAPSTGWDNSAVADGYWVIQLGILGLVGFIATLGPMLIPLVLTQSRLKLVVSDPQRRLLAGAALILGLVALDFIPNGLFSPYPYLMIGALAGATRELAGDPTQAAGTVWAQA
jgi:hypothetical protein